MRCVIVAIKFDENANNLQNIKLWQQPNTKHEICLNLNKTQNIT